MVLRLLGVCIVLVLIALSTHHAAAKLPSYVLTGGELGAYAIHVFVPIPAEHSWPLALLGEDARGVGPPQQLPALAYDLYPSYGNFAIPHQLANGGPELRYYPRLRVLHHRLSDRWYQLAPEAVAFLDTAIEGALVQKAAGELEMGPIAADYRARHLPEVEYWLRPRSLSAVDAGRSLPGLGPCRGCAVLVGSREVFIMRHLVETVSGPLQEPTSEPPAFVIKYYGMVEGGGGIGGPLGSYTPPTDDHPGRFWPEGYTQGAPYFETTPGFDSFVAEAIAAADGSSDAGLGDGQVNSASSGEGGRSFPMTIAIVSSLAAVLVALGSGAAALYSRRRGRS